MMTKLALVLLMLALAACRSGADEPVPTPTAARMTFPMDEAARFELARPTPVAWRCSRGHTWTGLDDSLRWGRPDGSMAVYCNRCLEELLEGHVGQVEAVP
jgi:hypothetical protein